MTGSGPLALSRDLLGEIARALDAGLPLPESLEKSAACHPDAAVREAASALARDLREGRSLSQALADSRLGVSPAVVAMILAAERAGSVPETVLRAERSLDAEIHQRARLQLACRLPLFSVAVALAVLGLLLVSTLPLLLAGRNEAAWPVHVVAAWPTSTRMLAGSVLGFSLVLGLLVAWRLGGARLRNLVPWASEAPRCAARALSCQALSELLAAEVPTPEALRLASQVLPSSRREAFEMAARRVEEGVEVAEALESLPEVSAALAIGAAGEASQAATCHALSRLGGLHASEAERLAADAVALTEALAMVAAGVIAGSIAIGSWSNYFAMSSNWGP